MALPDLEDAKEAISNYLESKRKRDKEDEKERENNENDTNKEKTKIPKKKRANMGGLTTLITIIQLFLMIIGIQSQNEITTKYKFCNNLKFRYVNIKEICRPPTVRGENKGLYPEFERIVNESTRENRQWLTELRNNYSLEAKTANYQTRNHITELLEDEIRYKVPVAILTKTKNEIQGYGHEFNCDNTKRIEIPVNNDTKIISMKGNEIKIEHFNKKVFGGRLDAYFSEANEFELHHFLDLNEVDKSEPIIEKLNETSNEFEELTDVLENLKKTGLRNILTYPLEVFSSTATLIIISTTLIIVVIAIITTVIIVIKIKRKRRNLKSVNFIAGLLPSEEEGTPLRQDIRTLLEEFERLRESQ
jgi:hypothetical protein